MPPTIWLQVLQWFPALATAMLAGIFIWRRLYRELPFFFLYLVTALVIGIARYAFHSKASIFFYIYWISDLVGTPVVFLAIYEVFLRRLFPGSSKTRFYRNLFPLVSAVILLLTILIALEATDQRAAFQTAARAFDFARTAILGFCVALILFMGRRWTKYNFAIVMGFAIQAVVALIHAIVRARLHRQPPFLGFLELAAYDAGCVIWLIGFWKPEKPVHLASSDQLSQQGLEHAREWEQTLKEFVMPGKKKS